MLSSLFWYRGSEVTSGSGQNEAGEDTAAGETANKKEGGSF